VLKKAASDERSLISSGLNFDLNLSKSDLVKSPFPEETVP